eukprot:CAMPEP_0197621336 /NCGR_PEP_ID=MMETSP1338-20131121/1938_1 /TAXON_ID=43686 ORGANISM="Pelagodinium beii, Strain RCC1491" /NCGR_SAMPLE_ID=MMETSP1338 /ASSEMBLY_ACC=CAM_ASM_000754 /LENGTH=532 /DNA_ID=CAMNT_0043190779 /DNA_START=23 /DNA_END=1621 /DNA_ORIENTATION=+
MAAMPSLSDMESGASVTSAMPSQQPSLRRCLVGGMAMAMMLGMIARLQLIDLASEVETRRLEECSSLWQQCGGADFAETCCEDGSSCVGNEYYKQCAPAGFGQPEQTTTSGSPVPCAGASCGPNPFAGQAFYVNPTYRESLLKSIKTSEGDVKETLESMMDVPSAYWLDNKGKIRGDDTRSMEGILKDASQSEVPPLVTFIVYDLPNRDCHAKASNGEICCSYKEDGRCDYEDASDETCSKGLDEYLEEYIKPIAAVLKEYAGKVPIVLVIEPDSLPNLSTNQADPRCGNAATKSAYEKGVSQAVKELAAAGSNISIYLDAGHGGWLGWKNNMQDYVQTIDSLGITHLIRGFATNVAGYQHLGEICPTYDWCLQGKPGHGVDSCCMDECGLTGDWNPSHNELMYALHLRQAFSTGIPGFEPHIIVDTGRNGVAGMRDSCKNWCNIRGAGVGHMPTTETAKTDLLDAYFWLKTPGESDGCTEELPDGESCPRFDADCGSPDSIGSMAAEPRAPEAGQWFDYQIKQLAMNAKMA